MNRLLSAMAAALALAAAGAAHAQAGTGSLAGWDAFGDVISQNDAITLTSAYLDGGSDDLYNVSGSSATDVATLETAAGVAPYALDLSASEYATEGSIATQSFAVAAGQTLTFQWSFATHEDLYQDHAFAVVGGQVFTLASAGQPGAGWQTFSHTFGSAGTVLFGIGVVDTVDVLGVSALSVTNLQVSAVPEPQTALLMLAGVLALGAAKRRR
jgi:hypothetical protein